jgi:hypothetical protein
MSASIIALRWASDASADAFSFAWLSFRNSAAFAAAAAWQPSPFHRAAFLSAAAAAFAAASLAGPSIWSWWYWICSLGAGDLGLQLNL